MAERPTNLRSQMPSSRQLHVRDGILDLQLLTERLESLPYTFAYVNMLDPILRAVQQLVAQPFVIRRGYPAGPGPCHGLALYRASVAAEQTLGRSPEKRYPVFRLGVEVEAARRNRLQSLE